MATPLAKLREQAKRLGITASQIRSADRDELEGLIEDAQAPRKPRKKAVAKKSTRTATRRTTTARKPAGRKPARKSATKSVPAKSARGTAKRQTTRRAATKATGNSNGYKAKGGRNLLDGVDYSETEGWNPRPGTAPDRIVKALRKFRGNREKVFDFLVDDIGDFVKPKKSDGSAWVKGDGPGTRKGMLRYRISRTAWQFALATGQHETASNRVEYGTGGTGTGTFKRAKSRTKASTTKTARKSTRKPAGRQRAAQSRTGAKRGRPAKAQTTTRRRAVRKTATRTTGRRAAAKRR